MLGTQRRPDNKLNIGFSSGVTWTEDIHTARERRERQRERGREGRGIKERKETEGYNVAFHEHQANLLLRCLRYNEGSWTNPRRRTCENDVSLWFKSEVLNGNFTKQVSWKRQRTDSWATVILLLKALAVGNPFWIRKHIF